MITAAILKSPAALNEYTVRELSGLARKVGVANWHSLRKQELIRTLIRHAKQQAARKAVDVPARKTVGEKGTRLAESRRAVSQAQSGPAAKRKAVAPAKPAPRPARKRAHPEAARKIQELNESRERALDLSQSTPSSEPAAAGKANGSQSKSRAAKDRIALLVRDSYWLQASWDITRQSVDRARVALAENWHTTRPVLRVLEVDFGTTTSTAERIYRDIEIHGGVRNWYIDVVKPPRSYRVEIGYLSNNGRFFSLARSNTVTTPVPAAGEGLDGHWMDVAENYERFYALSGGYADDHAAGELQELFEERLRRPMGSPLGTRFGVGAERLVKRQREFEFAVDAEMIVFGRTKPNGHVTLGGEPVKLRDDGTFAVRLRLPDRRQVLPIVASSSDGVEQRTIVLAVERNTKVMETVIHEANE